MNQAKKLESTSKFLSLVLRHAPETIGITLDPQGWVEIDHLLASAAQRGKRITPETLHEVVATCNKKRFAISDDGLSIRASQGHSIASVDLGLTPATPPEFLYHGTASRFIESIMASGLRPGSRNHVHLSSARETAVSVGRRHGKPVVLLVRALAMHQQGMAFYLSANGVWLTAGVPAAFLALQTEPA